MIRKLMFRLLPVQVILAAVSTVNMIVSSYFASNYVGTEAMSAVGLYGPLNMFFGAVAVMLVGGSSILCGEYLGQNRQDKLQEIFRILFMDKLGKREERLKELSTNELINEFEDRGSGNVSLIREELKHRYKEDMGDDRIKIAAVFRKGTKGDQKWLELQQRRELSTK